MLFLFDGSSLGKKELVKNHRLVRPFCQAINIQSINILSIPMSYHAILLWNSDKLRFKGKYPDTTRELDGIDEEESRWNVGD
ncbi:hypothetical protein CRE_24624 [Caenorhabditis remanei]|uniref:Uncharacterized protein n=1 Tax=Caenorhabditis remanei TaxID=31234 RepID=E3MVH3_CAERE|nr:hypothetical protein CRE_24624 [Caenorhabditis remanei]